MIWKFRRLKLGFSRNQVFHHILNAKNKDTDFSCNQEQPPVTTYINIIQFKMVERIKLYMVGAIIYLTGASSFSSDGEQYCLLYGISPTLQYPQTVT